MVKNICIFWTTTLMRMTSRSMFKNINLILPLKDRKSFQKVLEQQAFSLSPFQNIPMYSSQLDLKHGRNHF